MGEELYNMLVSDGLYTKGYNDFIQKYGSEKGQQELWQQMSSDGLYTKSIDDFRSKYFRPKEVKKKDQYGQGSGTVSQEGAFVVDGNFKPVTSDIDSPPLIDSILNNDMPPIGAAPPDVSGSVGEKIDPNFTAYDELKKKRGNDFVTNAYDLNRDKITNIGSQPPTFLEEKFTSTPTPSEELTGNKNPFKPEQQATFKEYKAMTNELVSENREINKSLAFLERQIKDSVDEKKTVELIGEYEKMSSLYDSNIKKYKEEIASGRYMDAVDFGDYLKEIQKVKDEKYRNASFAGKLARNAGDILLHSVAKAAQGVASISDVAEKAVGLEGENRGVGDKLQDLYIGLGDDVQNAFPSPTKMQRGGFTKTADWNGYEIDFKDDEIASIRKDGYVVDVELTKEQQEEIKSLKKEVRFHSGSFAYQTGSTIADAGVQILGAKGLGALGVGTKIGLAASTAGMMSNQLYQEGLNNGLSEENAARYALGTSSLIGISGAMIGAGAEERFLGIGLKTAVPNFGKGLGGAIGQKSYNVLKGGLGEVFEEVGLEKWIDAGMQHIMNKTADGEFKVQPYSDGVDILNEAMLSFVAGGLFDLAKNGDKTPLSTSYLMEGSKNIDETISSVKKVAESNNDPLTENEEQNLRNDLQNTQEAVSRTPEEVSSAPEVVALVAEKNGAENAAKEARKEIKETDSSFTAPLEQKVKRLDEKAEELKAEIEEKAKEVKSEPQYEPVAEESLEKGRVYFNEELGKEYRYKGKDEEGNHVFEKITEEGEVSFYQDQVALPGSNLVKGMMVDRKEGLVPGRKKKTVLTKRSYEGDVSEEVKSYLEEKGLERDVVSQAERSSQAEQLINDLGEEKAERAVRDYNVRGALASSILTKLIKRVDNQMWEAEQGSEGMSKLAQKQADLIELLETESQKGGEFTGQLAREYVEEDIGYAHEIQKRKYEKRYGAIPDDVDAKFKEIDTKMRRLRKEIVDAEKRQEEQSAQQAVTDIKESIEREKSSGKKTDIKERAKRVADNIRKGKVTRPDVFSAASPASLVWDGALEVVATSIEAGAAIADAVKKGVEHIRESEWYKGLTRGKQVEAENAFNNSFQEETVSDLKIPKQLIRDLVEGGIDDINDLVDAVRAEMGLDGYSDREVRDAITEYSKTVNMDRTTLTDTISKIKNLGRLLSQEEDILEGKRPKRSGWQRRRPTPEERQRQRQIRELMKGLPIDQETLADEIRTERDKKMIRLENEIEDMDRDIKRGYTVEKSKKIELDDDGIKKKTAERDAKKKEWEAIFRDEEWVKLQKIKKSIAALEKINTEYKRKLKEGDFSKKEKPPTIRNDKLTELRAEKLALKEQYDEAFHKKELEEMGKWERRREFLISAWGIPRVVMTGLEWSFMGIQGIDMTLDSVFSKDKGKRAKEAFKTAWEMFRSSKKTEEFLRQMKSQEWYYDARKAKLGITENTGDITRGEELFWSHWSNVIWGFMFHPIRYINRPLYDWIVDHNIMKPFERAAIGYLNTLRIEKFLETRQMMINEGKNIDDDIEDFRSVADAINTLTGRASLGKHGEPLAKGLTFMLFSPRMWAAQIKTATPYAFRYFYKLTPTARKMALAAYARSMVSRFAITMLVATLLNNDDDDETGVEIDPRSSDFFKYKINETTRLDPWSGRVQQFVASTRIILDMLSYASPDAWKEGDSFLAKALKGGFKNSKGEIVPLGTKYKSPSMIDLAMIMLSNKMNPSTGTAYKYGTKETPDGSNWETQYGDAYSFSDDMKEMVGNMFLSTIYDLQKDGINVMDALLIGGSFFGMPNVQIYESEEERKKRREEEKIKDKKEPVF